MPDYMTLLEWSCFGIALYLFLILVYWVYRQERIERHLLSALRQGSIFPPEAEVDLQHRLAMRRIAAAGFLIVLLITFAFYLQATKPREEIAASTIPQPLTVAPTESLLQALTTSRCPMWPTCPTPARSGDSPDQIHGSTSSTAEVDLSPLAKYFMLGLFAAIGLAVIGWIYKIRLPGTIAAAALVLGSAGMAIKWDGDLVKIKNLNVNFRFDLKPNDTPAREPTHVSIGIDVISVPPTGKIAEYCAPKDVGPFDQGEVSIGSGAVDSRTVATSLLDELTTGAKKRVVLLTFIGSADKTPMNSETRRKFNSNEGLARARALKVKEEFVRLAQFANVPASVTVNVAPTILKAEVQGAEQLSPDRTVKVCMTTQEMQADTNLRDSTAKQSDPIRSSSSP